VPQVCRGSHIATKGVQQLAVAGTAQEILHRKTATRIRHLVHQVQAMHSAVSDTPQHIIYAPLVARLADRGQQFATPGIGEVVGQFIVVGDEVENPPRRIQLQGDVGESLDQGHQVGVRQIRRDAIALDPRSGRACAAAVPGLPGQPDSGLRYLQLDRQGDAGDPRS
jgi:hypothetical protein